MSITKISEKFVALVEGWDFGCQGQDIEARRS